MVKKETLGRKGKIKDQPAHTREVKLGCIFTQSKWDDQGYAIRDADPTTYTGAIETAEEFGKRLHLEAWNRGWSRAQKKVVIGDGAEWIWNLADQHFPGAVQIVDLFHARQHLWDLVRKLYPNDKTQQQSWINNHQKRRLDKGEIENWDCQYVRSSPPILKFLKRFEQRRTTSSAMPSAAGTRSFVLRTSLRVPV